jgi:hypothetical protein
MPIDKQSMDMITPIFDFTTDPNPGMDSSGTFMHQMNGGERSGGLLHHPSFHSGQKGGGGGVKRSVSETKKKYVASMQDWKCGHCKQRLNHTFEVDHKLRLEHGGSNDVENLIALCRNCHGEKTAAENM